MSKRQAEAKSQTRSRAAAAKAAETETPEAVAAPAYNAVKLVQAVKLGRDLHRSGTVFVDGSIDEDTAAQIVARKLGVRVFFFDTETPEGVEEADAPAGDVIPADGETPPAE